MTNVASVAGVNADEYWDKGFTIVRGLYSAEEISDFRKRSLAYVGKHVHIPPLRPHELNIGDS